MKTASFFSLTFKLILVLGFVLALGACAAPAPSPIATASLPPTAEPTVTPPMATIRGTITYQGMPTPASMLYFISPQQSYSLEVPTGDPSAAFEYQLPAGSYQIIAYPVGTQDQPVRPAAVYSVDGSAIDFLTVTVGQVVEDIHVRNINSDNCVTLAFPASPDGLFAAMPETCSSIRKQEAQAILRGTVTYQAPPTPASVVYFISPEQWYLMELPEGNPTSSFNLQVAPGTYQIIAFPVGSQNLEFRPAAAYSESGSAIDFLTVTAGQVVQDIRVRNINSDRCISVPFPASPDGLFPAIEATCN
jgi:hypothetical protein